MMVGMKRPSYRQAIQFIALNDAPADNSPPEELQGYVSVVLVSEIFDVHVERVAADVYLWRKKNMNPRKTPRDPALARGVDYADRFGDEG